MLTPRMHDLLLFIDSRIKATGYCPSYDEMASAAGLVSKSGIHRLVKELTFRGFIRKHPRMARSIEVLRMPGDPAPGENETIKWLLDALRSIERTTSDNTAARTALKAIERAEAQMMGAT